MTSKHKGYVYFIGPEWGQKRIKIGYTRSTIRARLANLQTGSPYPLKLYAYMEGGQDLERVLHDTFAPMRLHGEWFNVAYKLEAFLIYAENEGADAPMSDATFDAIMGDVIACDDPMHPSVDVGAWIDSADCGVLSSWACDIAWAEYQAGRSIQ